MLASPFGRGVVAFGDDGEGCFFKNLLVIFTSLLHKITEGEKMKSNKKDPYNFEKIDGFIREYDAKTNGKKPMNGKIYQKGPRAERQGPSKPDGTNM